MKRILFAIVIAGWTCTAAPADSVPLLTDSWEAVYLNDAKVGYIHSRTDRVEAGGRQIIHSRQTSEMTVRRFNDQLKISTVTDSYELDDGRLYAIDSQMRMANDVRRTRGRLGADGKFHLEIHAGGNVDKQSIAWDKEIQGPYAHERSLKEEPLEPGETRTFKVFLPELNLVSVRTLKAMEWQEVTLRDGKKKRLLAVEDSNDQIPQKGMLWVDEEGDAEKSEIPFGELVMTSFRTSQAVAVGAPESESVDIGFQTLVEPDKPIPNAHQSKSVVYRLEFSDAEAAKAIPAASYQEILSREGKVVRIKVSRLQPTDEHSIDESAAAEYLEPNGFIQSDDPQIEATAKELTAGLDDDWKKVQALERWVDQNMINRDFTVAFADAKEVMRTRQGDCTEHSVLLAALLRAVGIPSRVAMGLVYLEQSGSFGYHMWTEALVDGRWYAADGTLGQGYVAGGHIKIADGSLKGASALSTLLPIFKVIGKMSIHVETTEN